MKSGANFKLKYLFRTVSWHLEVSAITTVPLHALETNITVLKLRIPLGTALWAREKKQKKVKH